MFKKKLCSGCKTGENYLLKDRNAPFCPYLQCCYMGKCSMYVPKKEHISFLKFGKKQGLE